MFGLLLLILLFLSFGCVGQQVARGQRPTSLVIYRSDTRINSEKYTCPNNVPECYPKINVQLL